MEQVPAFIGALTTQDTAALSAISSVTPSVVTAGMSGMSQAYAESVRVVYWIAVPIGAIACLLCFFLGDVQKTMNYKVDAPMEVLTAKKDGSEK